MQLAIGSANLLRSRSIIRRADQSQLADANALLSCYEPERPVGEAPARPAPTLPADGS